MTGFVTELGASMVAKLIAGMPYLDPTNGGTCVTATDAKSVFDLGQIITPGVVCVLPSISFKASGAMGDAVDQSTMTWRNYIVGKNFNRATGDGREGVLGEPGTDQMIEDMLATCHGKFISAINVGGEQQYARLFPVAVTWLGDTNSKIIYQFDWRHAWPVVEVE
jgi:hypothetical protein